MLTNHLFLQSKMQWLLMLQKWLRQNQLHHLYPVLVQQQRLPLLQSYHLWQHPILKHR